MLKHRGSCVVRVSCEVIWPAWTRWLCHGLWAEPDVCPSQIRSITGGNNRVCLLSSDRWRCAACRASRIPAASL